MLKFVRARHRSIRSCLLGAVALIGACLIAPSSRAAPYDALDTKAGGIALRYRVHGLQAMENGKLTEAISYFDRALALYPSFIRAHFDRGRALMATGQYDAAISEFTNVIAAYPEYPMVFAYRAQARLRQGNATASLVDFNQSLTTEIGMGPVLAAVIFANRSLAYEKLGQSAEAVADFDRAMRADSGDNFHDYRILNDRCYTAALIGLLESAQESCDESISRHARDLSVYDSRGLVELKSQAWDRAVADYTQALYYRPELPSSLYGRGLARRAKGDTAGAAADIAAATAGEPHIVEIMARLGVAADTGTKPAHKA